MLQYILFGASFLYGFPIQVLYMIIILLPLFISTVTTASYSKLIAFFGITVGFS